MKNLAIAVLAMAIAVPAAAGKMKVSIPLELKTDIVGVRDLHNGDWLTGIEMDILWLRQEGKTKPTAYLAANNLFNLDHAGRGSFGLALGANTGKAGETFARLAENLLPNLAPSLGWLASASNWLTLEIAGGYRPWGTPENESRWVYGFGGKVRIPLEKLWSKK